MDEKMIDLMKFACDYVITNGGTIILQDSNNSNIEISLSGNDVKIAM